MATHSAQNATRFEFISRIHTEGSPDILFTYRVHFSDAEMLEFTETVTLSDPQWSSKLPDSFVTAILEDLHLVLGISYYKLFCPPEFALDIPLSAAQADFWNTMYTKGLGEFLYRNDIKRSSIAVFSAHSGAMRADTSLSVEERSVLVGIGGGKDSIVSLEFLKDYSRTGFAVATGKEQSIIREVAEVARVPLCVVRRTLDPQVIAGVEGSFKGHVPISAVYAFLGVLQAALGGHAYVVVSNEFSSNFGNLMHEGNEVNHQWSKSSEFEILFQNYVRNELTPSIRYFSLLRPFYELRIVKMFTEIGKEYFNLFSSCNRNFTHAHEEGASRWCGECPKCAFAFLMLSAFLPKDEVVGIFKKDMFEDRTLEPLFKDILGFGTMKPFDCVGTFDESRVALSRVNESWNDSYMVRALTPLLEGVVLSTEVFKTHQALTIPTRFRLKGMESALILGYGREGMVSEAYLKKKFPEMSIGIADKQDDEAYLKTQEDFDVVIKTPVIPHEEVTRPYTTATQLFFSEVKREEIIGITGSKGKSTTATLLYLMLKESGKSVHLVGNIGIPALQHLIDAEVTPEDLFVFELSSYQLEDLDVSPHIAVVTSLFPEHIDHHGSLEKYYEAKRNITAFQQEDDVFVFPNGFPLLEEWSRTSRATSVLPPSLPFAIENKALRGDHMRSNVELAYAVAQMFGVDGEVVKKVVNAFVGLPHRLQHIGTYKDIEFYDDSISTTPESAIAGIRALDNVDTIILGGVDRGYQFASLEKELKEKAVRNVILFPESGEHMLASEEGFNVLHTSSMDEAAQFAYAHTQAGKSCLLSPAAPSYNLFKNFEERGDIFKSMVEKYGKI